MAKQKHDREQQNEHDALGMFGRKAARAHPPGPWRKCKVCTERVQRANIEIIEENR